MRIVFVNATHRWGGVKTWTLNLARGLAARGHEIHLVLRPGDRFAEPARAAGGRVTSLRFGPDWNPLAIRSLRRHLAAVHADIVITNVSKDNRIAGPAARALGIPVLQRVGRRGDLTDRRRIRFEQSRYVDHLVVPAAAIRDSLAAFPWMQAGDRVTVIPNGVDLARFRPGSGRGRLRRHLGLAPDVPVIAATGQLTRIKGHALLLDALARVDSDPSPVLVLIGEGPEESALRDLAQRLGLVHRVHFVGFQRDVGDWLEDADLAVQPSRVEGFPNSVVEFMAKGKAVLATAVDGVPEAMTHEVEGWLVPPENPVALAEGLIVLLADADLRQRLGEAARARAAAEFGLDLMVERVETLLHTLRVPEPEATR